MYNIRILEEASRELARLDKPVGRRIVERINWLSEKLNDIRPEPLWEISSGSINFVLVITV